MASYLEQIEANARTYQEQAFRVLDRDRTEIRHNSEWLAMPSDELFELIRRHRIDCQARQTGWMQPIHTARARRANSVTRR